VAGYFQKVFILPEDHINDNGPRRYVGWNRIPKAIDLAKIVTSTKLFKRSDRSCDIVRFIDFFCAVGPDRRAALKNRRESSIPDAKESGK
jgi:hypothetical protein